MEFKEALLEKSCPNSGRIKWWTKAERICQNRPSPVANAIQWQEKVAKGHPKRTKRIPNWCQNVPTSPKMMAKGKRKAFCIILNRFGEPLRHHFRQQFLWNAEQIFWKSMLEKYQLFIAISLKIHAEMMIQSDEKARCNLRLLWLCKEHYLFWLFYHNRSVENARKFYGKSTSNFQS